MLEIREANDGDVNAIREIFLATYGEDYPYQDFLQTDALKRLVYADDNVLLVAEETETGRVLGTASIVLDVGANADLVGEFGRLAVLPECRGRGAGRRLMQARLERVADRLHVGIVENRVVHPYSQKISLRHDFVPVGMLPQKLLFSARESVALYVRYFNNALLLRNNHPRVIPEAYPLAEMALSNLNLPCDVIVADDEAAYPCDPDFEIDELTTDGYATLLRFQRGRIRRREVFGPVRLHYGLFQLRARHSNYLIARNGDRVVGGIGFMHSRAEKSVRIFELISVSDEPVQFLIQRLEQLCRENWDVAYIEVDVNAHAPRMQQTFLQSGFLPVAYVPALVFHEVERLDCVKMARLLVPADFSDTHFPAQAAPLAQHIRRTFEVHQLLPELARLIPGCGLFRGLNESQARLLAAISHVERTERAQILFREGESNDSLAVVVSGTVELTCSHCTPPVATVGPGQVLGEGSLLTGDVHSATARVASAGVLAVFPADAMQTLLQRRADIASHVFRNLAVELKDRLRVTSTRLLDSRPSSPPTENSGRPPRRTGRPLKG